MVKVFVIFADFFDMKRRENQADKISKSQLIIETAQKRFGIYGIEKTPMREIADDLNLSKASLYYYFPDKESLFNAVIEKEQEEFLVKITKNIQSFNDPVGLLSEYGVIRLSYFRKLLNLSKLRFESFSDLNPVFNRTMKKFRDKEKAIIIQIFEKGINTRIFKIDNIDETASLFLDLLKGLRMTIIDNKKTLSIDQKEYKILLKKTLDFINVFLNGLKIK
jgi:AcrR family transcriptional regulator